MAVKQLSRDNFGIQQARFVLGGGEFPLAVGGNETVINPEPNVFYRVHSFTDVGESSLEVLRAGEFEYLVVGGGGGGGVDARGGGGGSGELGFFKEKISVGVYPAIIGAGGLAVNSGENSSFFGKTLLGGGRGGNDGNSVTDLSGGSGGGGAGRSGSFGEDPGGLAIGGFLGQPGGGGVGAGNASASGGGGGAGQPGQTAIGGQAGKGGDGLYFGDIFGDHLGDLGWFAGGGGGSVEDGAGANGGLGGGGSGHRLQSFGQPGQPNTGGGGGGVERDAGHAGGSGIVIIRYRISQADFLASGGVIE